MLAILANYTITWRLRTKVINLLPVELYSVCSLRLFQSTLASIASNILRSGTIARPSINNPFSNVTVSFAAAKLPANVVKIAMILLFYKLQCTYNFTTTLPFDFPSKIADNACGNSSKLIS